jgi:hypothetical protein
MKMKKILFIVAALLAFNVNAADSLSGDITSQGNQSYVHKSITAQQLATMIRDYEDTTAVNTLIYTECGKTIWLNSATEFATTLPAVTDLGGCKFKFIVKAAPVGTAYTIVTNGGSNLIDGIVVVNGASVSCVDEDTLTFTASAAISGDWVEVVTDGTNWYVEGTGNAATAIACSAT